MEEEGVIKGSNTWKNNKVGANLIVPKTGILIKICCEVLIKTISKK